MFRNGFITSWISLLQALETHFAPSFYDNPKRALLKLTQKGVLNYYLTKFECLVNCIVGLALRFLLSCFVTDLSSEIRCEVQVM